MKELERKRDGAMEILRNGRIRKNIAIGVFGLNLLLLKLKTENTVVK